VDAAATAAAALAAEDERVGTETSTTKHSARNWNLLSRRLVVPSAVLTVRAVRRGTDSVAVPQSVMPAAWRAAVAAATANVSPNDCATDAWRREAPEGQSRQEARTV
jgi:hypothetical protein